MIVRRIPARGVAACTCNGIGCTCGGACDACAAGVGDVATEPTILDKLWGALTTQLPIGGTGIPVWALVGAGLIAASVLMPKPRDYRRYR